MTMIRGAVLAVLLVAVSVESARIPRTAQLGGNGQVQGMATEDGLCDTVGSITKHELFCDRYYQCVQVQDDSGQHMGVWIIRACPRGTIFGSNGRCIINTKKTCAKAGAEVKRSLCTVGGDPHFRMFDNCWLHFQGLCTYVLAEPATSRCSNLTADQMNFTVEAEHTSLHGNKKFAFLKYIHLAYKTNRYTLDPADSKYVTLNGGTKYSYTSTALGVDNVSFHKRFGELTATLPNGVSVSVRKAYEGKVRVPPALRYCMQGLCGNFNGVCDDYTTPSGVTLPYEHKYSNQMGDSWKTDESCANTTSPPLPVCKLPKWKKVCDDVLSSHEQSPFKNCSLDPSYSVSCKSDICLFEGKPNEETKVKEVICEIARRAMNTECDSKDLLPKNLPEYCKRCNSSYCLNGGSCVEKVSTVSCNCTEGFQGKRCEEDINECTSNPCQHGGSCIDLANSYNCICVAGYAGGHCEKDIDDCKQNNCQNGATCVDDVNKYNCNCAPGYTGKYCQININDCASKPCQNGGSCKDGIQDYKCTCSAGYTGKNCETDIDDCKQNSCQNGATCVDDVNKYTCTCAPGYTGKYCQTNINDCASKPCQNGGSCTDKIQDYKCTCSAGYTGKICETVVSTCGLSCGNHGTCRKKGGKSECICKKGHVGNRCQINCTESPTSPECLCEGCDFGTLSTVRYHPYKGVCNAYLQCTRTGTPGNYKITYVEMPCAPGTVWVQDILTCNHHYQSDLSGCKNCASKPCKNGGTCTDLTGWKGESIGFKCNCAPGFKGRQCQQSTTVVPIITAAPGGVTTTTATITTTSTTTTTASGPVTPGLPTPAPCHGTTKKVDPTICGKYWEIPCSGKPIERFCPVPGTLVFDPKTETCNWKSAVIPAPNCRNAPYCKNTPCTLLGVKTCNEYEHPDPAGSCPYDYSTQNNNVKIANGAAIFEKEAYLRSDGTVNIGNVGKLTLEVSFEIATGGSAVQPLIADGDCEYNTTFSVILKRVSKSKEEYKLEGFVDGDNGNSFKIVSQVILVPNKKYNSVFAYNAYTGKVKLIINERSLTASVTSQNTPGRVKNGKGPLFVGKQDQHCAGTGRVQEYFTGKVFRYRVLAGDEIEDIKAAHPVPAR